MNNDDLSKSRIDVAMEYFRRVDDGPPDLLDLMTDDVQLFFPKFGTGYGKAEVGESAKGMMSSLQSIEHDFDRMTIHVAGDHVIVEGFEKGVSRSGKNWPDPKLSEGRYCNVFQFEGLLIKRVHIYVDPDFESTHRERFLWGDNVRMTRR